MAIKHEVQVGTKFGKLTVLKLQDEIRNQKLDIKHTALCKCDCGIYLIVEKYNLSSGNSTQCNSCAIFSRGNKTHGHSNPLKKETIEYKTYMAWKAMLSRCYNKNNKRYSDYGKRGIKVCERWKDSYENFLSDMGLIPEKGLQIDRIDNNGNYEHSNCRWATRIEQANNKRNNRNITAFGKTQTLQQWANETGIKRETIARRLNSGYEPEIALSSNNVRKHKYITPKGTFNTIKEAGEAYGLKISATHSRFNSNNYPEWIKQEI
jgi:DNA-binding phage protein